MRLWNSYADGKPTVDLAADSTMGGYDLMIGVTGTYVGDGAISHLINIGFQPNVVIVWRDGVADSAVFKWYDGVAAAEAMNAWTGTQINKIYIVVNGE